MQEKDDYSFEVVKERGKEINKVSPSFCLAKWTQSTVLLYNGFTHSCHHPDRHKINPDDLVNNPQGIHNTPVKMKAREDMLKGIQTSECNYCWNIENLGKDHVSDRIYKSTYSWSFPRLGEIIKSGTGKDVTPSYLEVAFDSKCNAKCLYCNPESSSSWEQEIKKFGAIPQVDGGLYDLGYIKSIGALPIPQESHNPYIDAFWAWWPEIYKKLKVLRVTGGEPLMSPHTWKLIDVIERDPRKDLDFSINTNLCLPKHMIERLAKKINSVHGKINSFEIYTSLESVGEQAEYVRHGMNYKEFMENCIYLLRNTPSDVRLHFMTTINMLSAPKFINYLKLLKEMRKEYNITSHNFRIRTFFNYLRWPPFLSLTMLPDQLKQKYGDEWIAFMEDNLITDVPRPEQCFYVEEVDQVKRLVEFMRSAKANDLEYKNFRLFIKAIDERRNLNFKETFPELSFFMNEDYYGQ